MIHVRLNESEHKLVVRVAKDRSDYDKENGFNDYRRAETQTAEFIEQNGLAGELAFCKAFNVYPDIATDYASEFDVLLPNGMKAEVKTTEYTKGHLIVRRLNEADIYVLVTGKMPDYYIAGYIKAQDLLRYETKIKSHKAYKVSQDNLISIEDLMARATKKTINASRRRTKSGTSNRSARKGVVGTKGRQTGRRRVSARKTKSNDA